MADPIAQFQIKKIATLGHIGPYEIALTNSAVFMIAAVVVSVGGIPLPTRGQTLISGPLQSLAGKTPQVVAGTVRSTAGNEGMKFFPFVFSLFTFVLVLNMFGMIPGFFTVTSHIVITALLALLVIFVVIIYGLYKNGFKFFKLFWPSGVPMFVMPMIVLIEILSFLSRPLSLSVRLFANMLAGHITIKVFASFIGLLATSLGVAGWALGILPFGMLVALTALDLLVAFLQAYVFAVLTCLYLNDAIHPGH
ncbi:MAG TPA: F0F1 ATP synthase subunit A [Xanthobacteraceae bacterium]|nr:F0F1 ATP synthase subunit A [Xanthobacteraceae bacterium]